MKKYFIFLITFGIIFLNPPTIYASEVEVVNSQNDLTSISSKNESRIIPGLVLITTANALIATYTATGWVIQNWALFEAANAAAAAAGLLNDTVKVIKFNQKQNKISSYITTSNQECVLHPLGTTWICTWNENFYDIEGGK
ncbi:MAG: hypothetical protein ACRCZJ_04545 [Erysipelotrichaceae bacterium]